MIMNNHVNVLDFQDASLELHQSENTFGDMECHGIGRPKKSLYVRRLYN